MQSIGDDFTREEAIKALSHTKSETALVASIQYYGSRGEAAAMELGYADAIARHLSHGSPEVVAAACEACGSMGNVGVKYADYITAAMHKDNAKVKAAAVTALGMFGAEASKQVPEIAKLAAKPNEEQVRVAAVQALGMIAAQDQIPLITELLSDSSPDVQGAACLALSNMGAAGEAMASDIAAKLANDGARYAAVSALSALSDDACRAYVGDIISKCLTDSDMQTRSEAMGLLVRMPDEVANSSGKLTELLKDSNPAVRACAALCLGNCGEKAAAQANAVAELLKDDAEDEAWLPLQVGGGSAREPMAMRKPKCAALVALGAMKTDKTAEVADFLNDPDWEVRFCAVEALGVIGAPAKDLSGQIAALLDDDTYPVRAKACFALGQLAPEDQVDRLAEMLTDATQSVRSEAAAAIGLMGEAGNQFSGELAKLLSDPSSPVRAAAAMALGNLGDGGKPYASIVAGLLYDADPKVVAEACSALGKMGAYGAAFAEDIAWFLEYPVGAVRAAAAGALGAMGAEAVGYIGELRMLTGDGEPYVAGAAREAISNLNAIEG